MVGPDLHAQLVQDTPEKFNMGTVKLPGPVAYPQQVPTTVIPVSCCRILPCQCLFITKQQSFMGGKKLCLIELGRVSINPDNLHEVDGVGNMFCQALIRLSHGCAFD